MRRPFLPLLLVLAFAVACARPQRPARTTAPSAPAALATSSAPLPIRTIRTIELVESVPIETSLDHPELRDAAEVWLEMLRAATSTIDLGQFYLSNAPGSRLEPIVAAIEAAIGRGVRARVLVERKFVSVYPETIDRLARAGAQVRHFDSASIGGILHAKYFIIDQRDGFLGSQNFDWRALEHIYELGARVREPVILAGLNAIFAADWARAGGEPVPEPAPSATRSDRGVHATTLVASPRGGLPAGVAWDLPSLVQLIDGATAAIKVQMLTYRADADGQLWDELEAPLRRAAARGVAVELMVADWNKRDKTIAGLQRLARTPGLAIRLVTIPPWSGGFIPFARVTHAKLLVVDGVRGWLGTSNWEKSYFYNSRNLGLLIDEPTLARQLDRFFTTQWQSPYATPIDPDARYVAPRIE